MRWYSRPALGGEASIAAGPFDKDRLTSVDPTVAVRLRGLEGLLVAKSAFCSLGAGEAARPHTASRARRKIFDFQSRRADALPRR